jgi:hypothetical protein
VSFPHTMENRENARKNLVAVLPDLKPRREGRKQWLFRRELGQLCVNIAIDTPLPWAGRSQ